MGEVEWCPLNRSAVEVASKLSSLASKPGLLEKSRPVKDGLKQEGGWQERLCSELHMHTCTYTHSKIQTTLVSRLLIVLDLRYKFGKIQNYKRTNLTSVHGVS